MLSKKDSNHFLDYKIAKAKRLIQKIKTTLKE